tara:strand:- start:4 stop:525 length:522 start_codon:yes stop_codon:yes gene_type:complete
MATNLQFIKSSTLTTSASEFLVTDCFNKGYDAYKILITNEIRSATGYGWLRLLDSSGSELSGSYYSGAGLHIYSSSGSTDRREPIRTEWKNFINYQGKDEPDMGGIEIMMFNPDDSSSYTFFTSQASTHYTGQFLTAAKSIGVYANAETVYGIKWYPQSGTINGTKVSVYGVK